MSNDRFHGRVAGSARLCQWPDCDQPGEFRAPGPRGGGFDGPGDYRWFCLEHVRAFNAGYDYFAGMSPEEIWAAQSPIHGWESEARAFRPTAGIDGAPRWADFTDPLDAIQARAADKRATTEQATRRGVRADGKPLSVEERRAFGVLDLPIDAERKDLRSRYSALVRLYHPDRNGGDRSHEAALQAVVEAYQLLRRAAPFA